MRLTVKTRLTIQLHCPSEGSCLMSQCFSLSRAGKQAIHTGLLPETLAVLVYRRGILQTMEENACAQKETGNAEDVERGNLGWNYQSD
jgi:hypothetical protein